MTKLRAIGLSQEDREKSYQRIIPDRAQKLIDSYNRIMSSILGLPKTNTNKYLNIIYTYCSCYPKEWILKRYCPGSTFLDYQPQK